MDGANMNAQVGLCKPGDIGADVCHLNLHKTFCIPHGGGGPGMGPIAVAPHLAPFLPGHPVTRGGGDKAIGPVSAAAYGSASHPADPVDVHRDDGRRSGLKRGDAGRDPERQLHGRAAARALSASCTRAAPGSSRTSCILDCRPFKQTAGIEVEDIAKRLMDYGFHAPTMSFPVAGHADDRADRERVARQSSIGFCDAMIAIRGEIREIEVGELDRDDNPLKHAPHPAHVVTADDVEARATHERSPRIRRRGCASTSSGRRSHASTTPTATATSSASAPRWTATAAARSSGFISQLAPALAPARALLVRRF